MSNNPSLNTNVSMACAALVAASHRMMRAAYRCARGNIVQTKLRAQEIRLRAPAPLPTMEA